MMEKTIRKPYQTCSLPLDLQAKKGEKRRKTTVDFVFILLYYD